MRALLSVDATTNNPHDVALAGMALMSTHPRDYGAVLNLSQELPKVIPGVQVVPCFGVHPWFLHELEDGDYEIQPLDGLPRWVKHLEVLLEAQPHAIVGEIGLDGFHFDPVTKDLVSPIDKQVEAFHLQMELAYRLQRPVSIHGVRCFGQLMDALTKLKSRLPPKLYFHAFGGKIGTVDQLMALCGRDHGRVYFGFAPVINFRSPKTADLVRHIGLNRLLLETDHEDSALVPENIVGCVAFLADTLGVDKEVVIQVTTKNAFDFYNLRSSAR